MATIKWKVTQILVKPTVGELENVVDQVHWVCEAEEGADKAFTYGLALLQMDNENFTAYSDLSEAQVIEWVKNSLGEEGVAYNEKLAAENLNKKLNPPIVNAELPW